MMRLFVGIPIPEHLHSPLIALQNGVPEARWVEPHNLHITLRFIGEVDEDVAEDLAQALDRVSTDPFRIRLAGMGIFGHPPHTLWVGAASAPQETLPSLHRTIDGVLIRAGLKPEGRKYTPHMTLARFGRRANPGGRLAAYVGEHSDLEVDSFDVSGFTVFQSVITHHGSDYKPLYIYDF